MEAYEVTIPLDKPQKLKLLFNNSAYIEVKKQTGKSVFSIQGVTEELFDPEMAVALLYAGTRKHHGSGASIITKECLLEWMDIVDPYDAIQIYAEVAKAFTASFLPRGKRQDFWKTVNKETEKAKAKMEQATANP